MTSLSGRPLLDTATDAALFVPLGASFEQVRAAADRGYSVLLHGPRGSGRTTLLRAVLRARRLEDSGPTVLVQAAAATSPREAVAALTAALRDATTGPSAPPPRAVSDPSSHTVAGELADLRALLGESGRVMFLVDNLRPDLAHRLFGVGRDDVWELDASFVVTADDADLSIVLAPPADAFFDVRVHIPAPTRAEAEELLARRLGRPVSWPGETGTPRRLLDAARADPDDPASGDGARRERLTAAARLGPSAAALGALLEEVGSVSPSDDIARERLGLTSARLSQILAQMYDGGLLTYDDVHRGGPGRPRRRYRWATGEEGDS